MKQAKTVDIYLADAGKWRNELHKLREILLATGLMEEVKWGGPCYTLKGKNVVGLGAFKSYFGLWFHQGALLEDKKGVLINAQEGKTRALRQWRMTTASDIRPAIIKSYVKEAMQLVVEGRAIKPDRSRPIVIPPELKEVFRQNKKAADNFNDLRLGLQREYTDYISDAKQEATKIRRIDKILPLILDGAGLNEKYR
jgi:uncharacterized protein YdeI (YjbR/CyaY-like superfamily)